MIGVRRLSLLLGLLSLAGGCGSPNPANIALRKENQKLRDQIVDLHRQREGDLASIAAYAQAHPTVPALPQERLDKLFTTHGVQFGRMTGGYRSDLSSRNADGLDVEIVPTDETGDAIKAAGTFNVQAFDLDVPEHPLVGSWDFDLEQARKLFFDHLTLYSYVLTCLWQHGLPQHGDLTVRVKFHDELTGREFTAQREVHVIVGAPNSEEKPGPLGRR